MKNIQVIDAAANCSYSIYEVEDEDFTRLFPAQAQDVEFIEDVVERLGEQGAGRLVIRATSRRAKRASIVGLHGTLFFGLDSKKRWYPTKREADFDLPLCPRLF